MKGLIVDLYPFTSVVSKGLANPGDMGYTTCGYRVQPLQSVKTGILAELMVMSSLGLSHD
jgi:hypothetical protein